VGWGHGQRPDLGARMPSRHIPVPDRSCNHPELVLPAGTPTPAPARLVGICGHNYA